MRLEKYQDKLNLWKMRALYRTDGRGENLTFLLNNPTKDLKYDLHVHSVESDGVKTPEQIGNEAEAQGVKILAIADHDTINVPLKLSKGEYTLGDYSGQYINAVEVTTRLNGYPVEVLVYDFDVKKADKLIKSYEFPFLNRSYKIYRIMNNIDKRIKIVNNLKLTEKPLKHEDFVSLEIPKDGGIEIKTFSELGIPVDEILVKNSVEHKEKINYKGKVYNVNFDGFNSKLYNYILKSEKGREYISSFKNQNGDSVSCFGEFIRYVLQDTYSGLFVDDAIFWPTVADVASFAKKAGGVAIFAHPYGYPNLQVSVEELVEWVYAEGIDGFEVWHGFNKPEEVQKLYNFCEKEGFLISSGSDTHGKPTRKGTPFEVGSAPGYEGEANKKDVINQTSLTISNLHHLGNGEFDKVSSLDTIKERGE